MQCTQKSSLKTMDGDRINDKTEESHCGGRSFFHHIRRFQMTFAMEARKRNGTNTSPLHGLVESHLIDQKTKLVFKRNLTFWIRSSCGGLCSGWNEEILRQRGFRERERVAHYSGDFRGPSPQQDEFLRFRV
jgi:hypothetical protein